jgi:hypothetical protein
VPGMDRLLIWSSDVEWSDLALWFIIRTEKERGFLNGLTRKSELLRFVAIQPPLLNQVCVQNAVFE